VDFWPAAHGIFARINLKAAKDCKQCLKICPKVLRRREMATWIVLICAVMASLAAGVVLAYGICMGMFTAFRIHSQNVASTAARRTALAGN
jgi:nitrate reductase NapE component